MSIRIEPEIKQSSGEQSNHTVGTFDDIVQYRAGCVPHLFFLFNICWASQLLQDDLRGWIRIGSQVLSKGSLRSLKIQLLNFDAVSEKAIGRKVRGKGGLCVKVAKYRQVPRANGVKRM